MAKELVRREFGGLSREARRQLTYHQEDPKAFPVPPGAENAAELQRAIYEHLGNELVKRKLIGKFPDTFINRNLTQIDALLADMGSVVMEERQPALPGMEEQVDRAKAERIERIDELQAQNEALEELRYMPHVVDQPDAAVKIGNWLARSSKEDLRDTVKRLHGRKPRSPTCVKRAGRLRTIRPSSWPTTSVTCSTRSPSTTGTNW